MKIIYSPRYLIALESIQAYISLDSVSRAKDFVKNLKIEITKIADMPYRYRSSIYSENKNIRDLIYKGYTIIFYIDEEEQAITILGIKKYREHF